MRRWITGSLAALALLAGVAAGCGSSAGDPEQPPPPAAGGGPQAEIARGGVNQEALDAVHAEMQAETRLRDHLAAKGAIDDTDGQAVFRFPSGGESCSVVVLLTSPQALATYGFGVDVSQPVVANPAGTMGVKASSTTDGRLACLTALSDALVDLD